MFKIKNFCVLLAIVTVGCHHNTRDLITNNKLDIEVFYKDKLLPTGSANEAKHWIDLDQGNIVIIKTKKDLSLDEFVKLLSIGDSAGFKDNSSISVTEKIELVKSKENYYSKSFLTQDTLVSKYSLMSSLKWDHISSYNNKPNPLGYVSFQEENPSNPSVEDYLKFLESDSWNHKRTQWCQKQNHNFVNKVWWDPLDKFAHNLNEKQKVIYEQFANNFNSHIDLKQNSFMNISLSLVNEKAFTVKKDASNIFSLKIAPTTNWYLNGAYETLPLVHWGFYFKLFNLRTANNEKVNSYTSKNLMPNFSQAKYFPKIKKYFLTRDILSWNEKLNSL